MVRPRFSRSMVLPLSRSSTISSNSRATCSASVMSPVTVISLPRTWIETGNAPSTRRNNSSRCPNRLTMRWLPGTSTLTWVCGSGVKLGPTLPARIAPLRRPAQRSAAEDVEVEVLHQLPGILADVGDHPVPALRHTFLLGYCPNRGEQVAEQIVLAGADGLHAVQVLLRDHQDVDGGGGLDVTERVAVLGLENRRRRH